MKSWEDSDAGCCRSPRHGDLPKCTYDVECLRSPYLLLFFSHHRFFWSCQVGRRRAGMSMAGWRAKTAIAVILAFLHEATATCPTFVAWLSSSKNRHGNVVRASPTFARILYKRSMLCLVRLTLAWNAGGELWIREWICGSYS